MKVASSPALACSWSCPASLPFPGFLSFTSFGVVDVEELLVELPPPRSYGVLVKDTENSFLAISCCALCSKLCVFPVVSCKTQDNFLHCASLPSTMFSAKFRPSPAPSLGSVCGLPPSTGLSPGPFITPC